MAAVTQDGSLLALKSLRSMRDDREIVLAAFAQMGYLEASDERPLRELVLATVHRDGMALRYASQELTADHEVALAAVKQDVGAIKWLRKSDRKVVLAAMKEDNVPSPSP